MARILKLKVEKPKFLRITKTGAKTIAPVASPAVVDATKADNLLVGKSVYFAQGGQRLAGKAIRASNGDLTIAIAVPSRDGRLVMTDNEIVVKANDTEVVEAVISNQKVAAFEAGARVELAADCKYQTIFEANQKDGPIADFRDVVIEGYASTFVSTTASDRGGDYIMPGTFDRTLVDFAKNPVILTDHTNEVKSLVGSWDKIGQNTRGLGVRGNISNAPGVRDTRFKLVEGHLKGLSIGGIWYYMSDGRGIDDAELFEISLVAVPMNPDALVYTRSLELEDCKRAFAKFWRSNSGLRDE